MTSCSHTLLPFYIGDRSCDAVAEYLAKAGHSPTFRAADGCVVFDEDAYHGKQITSEHSRSAHEFCGVSGSLLDRDVNHVLLPCFLHDDVQCE